MSIQNKNLVAQAAYVVSDIPREKLFVEYNRKYFCGRIVSSDIRTATEDDIQQAINKEVCDHSIIYDIDYWMYDVRVCAICGLGLGVI
jgi:hypothetical protein